MSFWDNVKKFAQPYGDDDYDDDFDDDLGGFDDDDAPRAETKRQEYAAPAADSSRNSKFSGQLLSHSGAAKQEIILLCPANFDDAHKAAEDLRDRKAVIVNLDSADSTLACRVVDFLSGCAFALDGNVKKIAETTYLFSPHSMDVVGDLPSMKETELYI